MVGKRDTQGVDIVGGYDQRKDLERLKNLGDLGKRERNALDEGYKNSKRGKDSGYFYGDGALAYFLRGFGAFFESLFKVVTLGLAPTRFKGVYADDQRALKEVRIEKRKEKRRKDVVKLERTKERVGEFVGIEEGAIEVAESSERQSERLRQLPRELQEKLIAANIEEMAKFVIKAHRGNYINLRDIEREVENGVVAMMSKYHLSKPAAYQRVFEYILTEIEGGKSIISSFNEEVTNFFIREAYPNQSAELSLLMSATDAEQKIFGELVRKSGATPNQFFINEGSESLINKSFIEKGDVKSIKVFLSTQGEEVITLTAPTGSIGSVHFFGNSYKVINGMIEVPASHILTSLDRGERVTLGVKAEEVGAHSNENLKKLRSELKGDDLSTDSQRILDDLINFNSKNLGNNIKELTTKGLLFDVFERISENGTSEEMDFSLLSSDNLFKALSAKRSGKVFFEFLRENKYNFDGISVEKIFSVMEKMTKIGTLNNTAKSLLNILFPSRREEVEAYIEKKKNNSEIVAFVVLGVGGTSILPKLKNSDLIADLIISDIKARGRESSFDQGVNSALASGDVKKSFISKLGKLLDLNDEASVEKMYEFLIAEKGNRGGGASLINTNQIKIIIRKSLLAKFRGKFNALGETRLLTEIYPSFSRIFTDNPISAFTIKSKKDQLKAVKEFFISIENNLSNGSFAQLLGIYNNVAKYEEIHGDLGHQSPLSTKMLEVFRNSILDKPDANNVRSLFDFLKGEGDLKFLLDILNTERSNKTLLEEMKDSKKTVSFVLESYLESLLGEGNEYGFAVDDPARKGLKDALRALKVINTLKKQQFTAEDSISYFLSQMEHDKSIIGLSADSVTEFISDIINKGRKGFLNKSVIVDLLSNKNFSQANFNELNNCSSAFGLTDVSALQLEIHNLIAPAAAAGAGADLLKKLSQGSLLSVINNLDAAPRTIANDDRTAFLNSLFSNPNFDADCFVALTGKYASFTAAPAPFTAATFKNEIHNLIAPAAPAAAGADLLKKLSQGSLLSVINNLDAAPRTIANDDRTAFLNSLFSNPNFDADCFVALTGKYASFTAAPAPFTAATFKNEIHNLIAPAAAAAAAAAGADLLKKLSQGSLLSVINNLDAAPRTIANDDRTAFLNSLFSNPNFDADCFVALTGKYASFTAAPAPFTAATFKNEIHNLIAPAAPAPAGADLLKKLSQGSLLSVINNLDAAPRTIANDDRTAFLNSLFSNPNFDADCFVALTGKYASFTAAPAPFTAATFKNEIHNLIAPAPAPAGADLLKKLSQGSLLSVINNLDAAPRTIANDDRTAFLNSLFSNPNFDADCFVALTGKYASFTAAPAAAGAAAPAPFTAATFKNEIHNLIAAPAAAAGADLLKKLSQGSLLSVINNLDAAPRTIAAADRAAFLKALFSNPNFDAACFAALTDKHASFLNDPLFTKDTFKTDIITVCIADNGSFLSEEGTSKEIIENVLKNVTTEHLEASTELSKTLLKVASKIGFLESAKIKELVIYSEAPYVREISDVTAKELYKGHGGATVS